MDWLEKFGFGQKRCFHCLKPYFPARRDLLSPSLRLCAECQKELAPFTGLRCKICGMPLARAGMDARQDRCPRCASQKAPWDSLRCYGFYEGALRDLILRLKFDGELHLAHLFADFLAEMANCLPRPDLIVPVPQYPAHLRKRGYNQANEIARSCAALTGLPYSAHILLRIKPGLPQENLNALERQANLRGAFAAAQRLDHKLIWLIDDVFTTGSTCLNAAQALLAAGANSVHVLCMARTIL